MNTYKYHITEKEFIEANKYVQRKRVWMATGLATVLTWFILIFFDSYENLIATGSIGTILALLIFSIGIPLLQKIAFRRVYRKNSMLHNEQEVSVTESGIHFSSKNGEANYIFDEFVKVEVLQEMILVFPTTQIFHIIPTRILDDASLELLRKESSKK